MEQGLVYKLMDLIEDVKKLDELILIHRQLDASDFMVSQYEAKKPNWWGHLSMN